MHGSTAMFFAGAALGAPAWVVDMKALPDWASASWLAGVLLCAAIGFALWAFDRK